MGENSWSINASEQINNIVGKRRDAISSRFQISSRSFFYFAFLILAYFIVTLLVTIALCSSTYENNNNNLSQFDVGSIWTFNKDVTQGWQLSYTTYQYALLIIFVLILFFLAFGLIYFWIDCVKTKKIFATGKNNYVKLTYFFTACFFILAFSVAFLVELTNVPKNISLENSSETTNLNLGHLWVLAYQTNNLKITPTSSNNIMVILTWVGLLALVSSILLVAIPFKKKQKNKKN